jgi:heme exporter protein C
LTFFYAPVEMQMGLPQKIFYFHVPTAWVSFLAFTVTFICSLGYLRTRKDNLDIWAISSAEIGLLFCTAAIITGSIWAKGSWNTWWDWRESRLTTTLALWALYAAYLILRTAFEDEQKRINAAVMGIVSFVMVPIVFFSIRWWGGDLHPPVGIGLTARMKVAFFTSLFTFTLFYIYLLLLRSDIENLTRQVEDIRRESISAIENF